ncbi:MAG: hypothetical protein ACI3XI_01355 [Eubacteriales bacterium]
MKRFIAVMLAAVLLTLGACAAKPKYDEKSIVGRPSSVIIEQYGEFDLVLDPSKLLDGEYRNISCGYLTGEGEYYMISFDSDGIAFKTEADVKFERE